MATELWLKNAIKHFENGYDGVYYTQPNEYGLSIVIGWEEGYDIDGSLIQTKFSGDTIYTLCGKVAYNCDDLQCDYNFEWYMPRTKEGDVYDSSVALTSEKDIHWLNDELEYTTKEVSNGNLIEE